MSIRPVGDAGACPGPIRLWDPLARLGAARHAIWIFLAANLVVIQWPVLLENTALLSPRDYLPDFFQDYASCKNVFRGLPVYAEHELTARLYLKSMPRMDNMVIHVNAHPPTSVILALPFFWTDFGSAFVATNLVSLAALFYSLRLVVRGLGIEFGPACYAPTLALSMICYPVLEHLFQGQLGLYISAMLLGAWACERDGRPRAAGVLIGLAGAIKLFPLFLLAFFAWRRRFDIVVAGLATVVASTAATACILGVQAYLDYVFVVMPQIGWFRVGWNNASILGFFSRLFDPLPAHPDNVWWKTRALVQSTHLLKLGYALASASLLASFAWATSRLEDRTERDIGFGLAMVCIILLSPVAWEHYLVLTILPLGLVWAGLPQSGAPLRKFAFLAVVALLWARPRGIHIMLELEGRTARPSTVLLFLSTQFYALVVLYALGIDALVRHRRSPRAGGQAIPNSSCP